MARKQPLHMSQCPLPGAGGCAGQRQQLHLHPHRLYHPSTGPHTQLVTKPGMLQTPVSSSIAGPGHSLNSANIGASWPWAAQGIDSSKPNASAFFPNTRTAYEHWSQETGPLTFPRSCILLLLGVA